MSESTADETGAVLNRATIFYDQPGREERSDLRLIHQWCERWESQCRISIYGRDGWILWDIEGPSQAIAELPTEVLSDSGWARSRPDSD